MCAENQTYPNFLERKDPTVAELIAVIYKHFKMLRSSGIGNSSKHNTAKNSVLRGFRNLVYVYDPKGHSTAKHWENTL